MIKIVSVFNALRWLKERRQKKTLGKSSDRTQTNRVTERSARKAMERREIGGDTSEERRRSTMARGYTFCGPIHQIGCGMFRVISQPFWWVGPQNWSSRRFRFPPSRYIPVESITYATHLEVKRVERITMKRSTGRSPGMSHPHLRHQILQEINLVIYSKYHRAKLRIGRDGIGRNAIQSSNWLWRVAPLNFISQPFLTIWIAVLRIAFSAYTVRHMT